MKDEDQIVARRASKKLTRVTPEPLKLSERQLDVLRWLDDEQWQRPMDVGAFNGSHHSATLSGLAGKGLVERKKYHAIYCCYGTREAVDKRGKIVRLEKPITLCRCKGSCRYRRTPAGRDLVARELKLR